ncbi:MAG: thioredoxin family protein [Candidatus Brocadiia bacterium]
MVISTRGEELDNMLRTEEGYSLLDFTAPWCAPCKRLDPVVQCIASEKVTNLKVFRINVDEDPMVASRFGVRSIPNLVLVKDGKPVAKQVGRISEVDLREWLAGYGV